METAETKKENIYELAFILKVGASEADFEALLAAQGVKIANKRPVTAISLAYPIKKQTAGSFGYYHVIVPSADSISSLSQTLTLADSVIRFIFVKIPKEKKPSKKAEKKEGEAKKAAVAPAHLDTLSNEKLSETLEEILK